jgi:two-component system sensor histidine kinase YesM
MSNMMKNQITYAININFQQTLDHLEAYISSFDTLAFTLSRIDDFQFLYQNRGRLSELSANDSYIIRSNLFTKIHTAISRSKNSGFSFYLDDDISILANNETYYNFDDIKSEVWFEEMIRHFAINRRSFLVCPPDWIRQGEQHSISFIRTMFNKDYYWDLFGFVNVKMPLDNITGILKKNITVEGTVSYLLNYRQEIIASCMEDNDLDFENHLPFRELVPSFNNGTINLSGRDYMVWQAPVGKYHLNLITIIPVGAISNKSFLFGMLMMVSLLILSFGAALLFRREFSFLTERIKLVIKNMQATNNGVLTTISREPEKDEVGQLIANYNKMVENLKNIMEDNRRSGIELKNYELQILWEQINPHFLYNNLEMINWLSKNGQNEKVSLAVSALALFYQGALGGGMQKIQLSKELEHIRTYINLQNMRFENVLDYKCNVHVNADSLFVPRNILQPIVENSIIHGILEKESGTGIIVVTIKAAADLLTINLEDDGIGVPAEVTARLNLNLKTDTFSKGYGVMNVAKRIKLMYGASYGLFFRSEYKKGTYVTITLPLDRNSPVESSERFALNSPYLT